MVQGFNLAMKAFADGLPGLGCDENYTLSFVGEGPYNKLERSAYAPASHIRYGQESHKEGIGKSTGLFGVFGLVHLPEIQMSSRILQVLGKEHGCRLAFTKDGRTYAVPLQDIKLGFVTRENGMQVSSEDGKETIRVPAKAGKITLAEDTVFTATDGSGAAITLSKNTGLTRTTQAMRNEVGRSWEEGFSIVDAKGKSLGGRLSHLSGETAVMALWCNLTAVHGLKRQGNVASPGFNTMATDGPDDDFNAERMVVGWLRSFTHRNGIDLMPKFNGYVASAGAALNRSPDLLQPIAHALKFAEEVGEIVKAQDIAKLRDEHYVKDQARHILGMAYAAQALRHTADMLQLKLPEVALSEEDRAALARIESTVPVLSAMQHAKQCVALPVSAFDPAWREEKAQTPANNGLGKVMQSLGDAKYLPAFKEALERFFGSEGRRKMGTAITMLQKRIDQSVAIIEGASWDKAAETVVTLKASREALVTIEERILRPSADGAKFGEDLAKVKAGFDAIEAFHARSAGQNFNKTQWEKAAPNFRDFFATMEAVDCDAGKLMAVYRNSSAFMEALGKTPVPEKTETPANVVSDFDMPARVARAATTTTTGRAQE